MFFGFLINKLSLSNLLVSHNLFFLLLIFYILCNNFCFFCLGIFILIYQKLLTNAKYKEERQILY